ncbi:MAG: hypothetical protein QM831_21250 [Kofleriaceae bacterium]
MKRLAILLVVACSKRPDPAVTIPKLSGELKIDGELGEPAWNNRSLRHVLTTPTGEQSRPFSEVRFLHDDANLYVGLYAADENIQSQDFFDVKIGDVAFHADPTGKITPPGIATKAAVDLDGTLDNPANDDEEWVLEIVIPLSATALANGTKAIHVSRCDTPKDGHERCGEWSTNVKLE